VLDRSQATLTICTQADMLDRRCTIASDGKHVLPREGELYQAAHNLSGHDRKNNRWMSLSF
jgi:hypothetical protein